MALTFRNPRSSPEMSQITLAWAALRPPGGFQFIMADPPWHFEEYSAKGNKAKSVVSKYQMQSDLWIASLPVDVLAAEHCLLWLWITNPKLMALRDVLDGWGFEFRTLGVWRKVTASGALSWGTGRRLRSCHEPYALAVRGRPRVQDHGVPSVFDGLRREHSRKPEEAYALAERMSPGQTRIELFSRANRPGWASWGDETGKFDGEAA